MCLKPLMTHAFINNLNLMQNDPFQIEVTENAITCPMGRWTTGTVDLFDIHRFHAFRSALKRKCNYQARKFTYCVIRESDERYSPYFNGR